MSEMKIDKNLPIPSRPKYPFNEMEINDSFAVSIFNLPSVRTYVYKCNKLGKKQFTVRKIDDDYRCWRIA